MSNTALSLAAQDSRYTWLETSVVAQILNINEGNVRKKCLTEWLAQGLCRQIQADGKRQRWQIRSDADPRLSLSCTSLAKPAAVVEVTTGAITAVHEKARAWALEKKQIIARWQEKLRAAEIMKIDPEAATLAFLSELNTEFIAKGRPVNRRSGKAGPSRATLYNWLAEVQQGAGDEGLIDGRSKKKAQLDQSKNADPFLLAFKQIWANENQRGMPVCYSAAVFLAGQNGWKLSSFSAARRFVEGMDKREMILKRKGEEAFVNEAKVHHIRDYTTGDSNDQWVSDHHRFDVWVKTGMKWNSRTGKHEPEYDRPWLTVWMDMRSRKIVAWTIRAMSPAWDVVLQTLCAGCLTHYIPADIHTDNGKDFDNKILTGETKQERRDRRSRERASGVEEHRILGIYNALGIHHTHAIPNHPQSKTVERFFRTVCDRFSKLFPTYCGNSPENRPEGVEERRDRGLGPDLETFRSYFGKWVEDDYNNRVHTGDGMNDTPARVWEANLRVKRTAPREVLEVLMQPRFLCKVNQLGVQVSKLTYGRFVLNGWIGQEVFVRQNPADVSSVSIWTARDEFICFAPCNESLPMHASVQDLKAAQKQIAEFTKKQKEAWETPQLAGLGDIPSTMLAAAAEKAAAAAQELPALPPAEPVLKLVRTDIEGQMKELDSGTRALPSPEERPAAMPSMAKVLDAFAVEER